MAEELDERCAWLQLKKWQGGPARHPPFALRTIPGVRREYALVTASVTAKGLIREHDEAGQHHGAGRSAHSGCPPLEPPQLRPRPS